MWKRKEIREYQLKGQNNINHRLQVKEEKNPEKKKPSKFERELDTQYKHKTNIREEN